jgi:hypothetical protein
MIDLDFDDASEAQAYLVEGKFREVRQKVAMDVPFEALRDAYGDVLCLLA